MTSVYQGLARFDGHIRKSGGQALGTRLLLVYSTKAITGNKVGRGGFVFCSMDFF
jgi:hypothetical protein